MAVPGHDQRDFAFAKAFDLPVRAVVEPPASWLAEQSVDRAAFLADPAALDEVYAGDGQGVHSSNPEFSLDGRPTTEAKREIIAWLESRGIGKARVQYKLRDWLFSRQRYWGEPFPIVCTRIDGEHNVPSAIDEESTIPVELPVADRAGLTSGPRGRQSRPRPPTIRTRRRARRWPVRAIELKYGSATAEFDGESYKRELNTMPQWAGSCWYYLRYHRPQNQRAFRRAPDAERYWMTEARTAAASISTSAVSSMRCCISSTPASGTRCCSTWATSRDAEPFGRLFNQGYIQAYAYPGRARHLRARRPTRSKRDGGYRYRGTSR